MKTTYRTEITLLAAKAGSPADLARIETECIRDALQRVITIQEKTHQELVLLREQLGRRTAILSPTQGFSMENYVRRRSSCPLFSSSSTSAGSGARLNDPSPLILSSSSVSVPPAPPTASSSSIPPSPLIPPSTPHITAGVYSLDSNPNIETSPLRGVVSSVPPPSTPQHTSTTLLLPPRTPPQTQVDLVLPPVLAFCDPSKLLIFKNMSSNLLMNRCSPGYISSNTWPRVAHLE